MTAPEIPWAGPPLLSDEDVITILREGGAHPRITGEDEIDRAHLAKCNMVGAIRLAYAKGLGEAHHDETAYDNLIERLMTNMPDSWDSDEGAESLVIEYVCALETRVKALGGHLERYDGGAHAALGAFYAAAENLQAEGWSPPMWQAFTVTWDEYVRVKAAAE